MHVALPTAGMLGILTAASISIFAVAVLAPEAAPAFGVDPKAVGAFTSLLYLFAALTGGVTSVLVKRFGGVRTCQFAMVSAALGMGAFATGWIAAGVLSAVLLGIAYGPFNPASAHVLGRVTAPRWRPLVFSIKQCGVPLGAALAGVLLPALVAWTGWRGAALAVGGLAIAAAAAVQPIRETFDADRDPRQPLRGFDVLSLVRFTLSDPTLRRYTLMAFFFAGAQLSVGAFMVVYYVEVLGYSLMTAGLTFTFLQTGGVVGRLIWGGIAEQILPSTAVLAVIGVVTAVCAGMVTFADPGWPAWAVVSLSAVLGLSSFGWNGVMLSEVASHAPAGRAADATAGMQVIMFGGIVVFPSLFAAVVTLTGTYTPAFVLIAAMSATGALVALSIPAAPRRDHDHASPP